MTWSNHDQSSERNELQAILDQYPPEIQQIVTQVLQLEKKRLYQKAPRHINEEILTIIKDVVNETQNH